MSDRSCPSCHEPVAAHQTLCPACRTPVPSEAGPVATDTSPFTFSAPPPRRSRPADPTPEPVIGSDGKPSDPITGSEDEGPFVPRSDATAVWQPGLDATAVAPTPVTARDQPAWNPAPAAPAPAWNPSGASAGTIGTPGAAVLDERGNLPGGLVGLAAAALVTIGVFLPWIAVEGREVSGWAASGDAKGLLVLAGLATVIAALLIGGARSLVLRLGQVGLGVVALGVGAYEIASARGIDEFDVDLGLGLVVVLFGGLVLAVAGGLTRHQRYR